MNNLIKYFTHRHILSNVIFFGTIIMAIFVWQRIGKEEMPEFASNWVRVTTVYPGAPAEDVELFVTKPIEDELKSVVGIEEVVTTSNVGSSSFRIVIDDDYPDKDDTVRDIKDAVLRAELPSEVRDLPRIRQFKSAEKAILDIGLYYKGVKSLDQKSREKLQEYALAFENQLLALPEVSSIDKSHYRKPEVHIEVLPEYKHNLEFSLSEIKSQIQSNNIRTPLGSLLDKGESKVTALNELETVEALNDVVLRGNYDGRQVKLSQVATVKKGFERSTSIFKVNGHEGVFLNIKKSVTTDILTAQAAIMKFIDRFNAANKDSPIGIVLMDDESFDVKNRINIIGSNGIIGFVLILIILFIFLDIKSGFWVAMGIPFTMAFTLIVSYVIGYTINNMTLAGIIIVLGIVVDDAIIIAENISRRKEEGMSASLAAVIGTSEVFRPILASIVTTCIAFVPLVFFEGFFGKLVSYIPLVVILMLIASLIESLLVLPSHMVGKTPILDRFAKDEGERSWFYKYEELYAKFLEKVIKLRIPVLLVFIVFLIGGGYIFKEKMNFVMFPREESQEVFIKIRTPKDFDRFETAKALDPLEEMFVQDTENVVGVRSSIAIARRGGASNENEASVLVELKSPDERKTPLNRLLKNWEEKAKEFTDLKRVRFLRGRFGSDSGSAVDLQIQENDDAKRSAIVKEIEAFMSKMPELSDVEVDEPLKKKEYLFNIKQDRLVRYNLAPSAVTTALRTFVEGSILYSINKGEEEVDVRLTVPASSKENLEDLLELRVENRAGQLAYLKNIVDIKEVNKPVNIKRTDYKRMTMIYGEMKEGIRTTPLQIAEILERELFPSIEGKYPSAVLKFRGEIEDSRNSQGEFRTSIIVVIIMIYFVLMIMFNSVGKPLLVLSIVPFGLSGVVYALFLHGMSIYGFFAVIGALGMIGVIVNDAIVMINKLDERRNEQSEDNHDSIARISATRLRPVLVTTITTVAGILPTAYGVAGYDSMLAEMMLTMGWGLAFGTFITLVLIPCLYSFTVRKN